MKLLFPNSLIAAVLLATVSSCTASGKSDRLDAVSVSSVIKELAPAVWRADQKFIELCMRKAGFEYVRIGSEFVPPLLAITPPESVVEASTRQREGYGLADSIATAAHRVDPNRSNVDKLDKQSQTAFAKSYDKCRPFGDGGPVLRIIGDNLVEFEGTFRNQREVRLIYSEWSRCMRGRGYDAVSIPRDLIAVIYGRAGGEAPTPEAIDKIRDVERKVASDDSQCLGPNLTRVVQLRRDAARVFVQKNERSLLAGGLVVRS